MWREQFNAEMLPDLDTIRTDESTTIRAARRTDVRPTAVGDGLCQGCSLHTVVTHRKIWASESGWAEF